MNLIMKKVKLSIVLVLVLALIPISVNAYQLNSSNYRQNVIVSEGGEKSSSSSYNINVAVGIINSIISSASYANKLGFFHLLLLADSQPCTLASQCEGGYCCSSLCKSSACSSPSVDSPGGGGGGGAGGGGGGGGGAIASEAESIDKTPSFSVVPASVKEHIALGASKTSTLTIKNTAKTALGFNLNVETIKDLIFLSDSSFSLEPGEEKIVELNIVGKKLGSYLGRIAVKSGGIQKLVDAIVEVESENVLFDAKIDIPSAYKEIEAGGEMKAQITLLNVGPPRKVDVTTTYIIKDREGNIIYESSETFAVEKQTSFVKSFRIPKDIQPGDYLAIVELRYEKSFAVSSELFKVVPKTTSATNSFFKISKLTIVFLIMVIAGLVFLFAYLLVPKKTIIDKFRRRKK